jgi:hypothetical protein
MCSGSYKAPKAQPTPPAPDAPGTGATTLVFNNGSGASIEDQLKALSQLAVGKGQPYKGPHAISTTALTKPKKQFIGHEQEWFDYWSAVKAANNGAPVTQATDPNKTQPQAGTV